MMIWEKDENIAPAAIEESGEAKDASAKDLTSVKETLAEDISEENVSEADNTVPSETEVTDDTFEEISDELPSERVRREKEKISYKDIMLDGLWRKNPTLVQLLGMCATLAVTNTLLNGLALGICTTVVLIFSNIFISLVRKIIPRQIRIASYIVIISSFVTVVELIMKAYFHELNKSLGIFIPLIVVNCIILARAEAFASRNSVLPSAADGLFMGLGFTAALACMGAVREILGNGSIFGINIMPEGYVPTLLFVTPAGAFITLGVLIAIVSSFNKKEEK